MQKSVKRVSHNERGYEVSNLHLSNFTKYKGNKRAAALWRSQSLNLFPSSHQLLHRFALPDVSGEAGENASNSEISHKQNSWFLQISNSWWCYLAGWPSAQSRQSGVAWPDLLSAARLAGGWGALRERGRRGEETGSKGRGQIKYQTLDQVTHTKLN